MTWTNIMQVYLLAWLAVFVISVCRETKRKERFTKNPTVAGFYWVEDEDGFSSVELLFPPVEHRSGVVSYYGPLSPPARKLFSSKVRLVAP